MLKAFLGACMGMVFSIAASETSTSLVVIATGFQDSSGLAVFQVFGKVKSIIKDAPTLRQTAEIQKSRSKFIIEDFPSGKWAIMVFQDRNENGTLDHGWNRLPLEAMGYSNGFVPGLISGMPSYEKLAVDVSGANDTLNIQVKPFSLINSEPRIGQ
jgi:uncharacterized protein (DUF2141 family)